MGRRVIILAGGTGGHVYPGIAVASELMAMGHEVVWVGTQKGLEAKVVTKEGIPIEWLTVNGIRGKGVLQKLKAPFMLIRAMLESRAILRKFRPHVVLGMGGFVSGPGGLMAQILGIPLVIHEQNRVPGTTNRWLSRLGAKTLQAFPETFPAKKNTITVGNPLRAGFKLDISRKKGFPADRPMRILVVGGSLGAKALNDLVPEALAMTDLKLDVLHQTGERMFSDTVKAYSDRHVRADVRAYIEDMIDAYNWADLAICRAGAMTVSELIAVGLPAILVPYPYAIDDHQTKNALYLSDAGAAVALVQAELSAEGLSQRIKIFEQNKARLLKMSESSAYLAKPESAKEVAQICVAMAKGKN